MLEELATNPSLHGVLQAIGPMGFEHIDHWKQGEFHHDIVLRIKNRPKALPGEVLVISTNCNGGVKEILCLEGIPERWALWNYRCPENPEFEGSIPRVSGFVRTVHWFDPCNLLTPDTTSEYKPESRRRQRGGGWVPIDSKEE